MLYMGGIGCDNLTGHVIKLNLTNPFTNGQLSYLGGFINDSLKKLNHLQYLDLSFNEFENNHIPSFLGSLQNLKYLNLSQVGFGIRADNLKWLSNLSLLEVLDMSWIDLSRVSHFFQITFGSLVTLDLSSTSISVQGAFSIPSLRNLHLARNDFTVIPDWLCNITNLERLDLSSNNIAHVLPSDIGCLSHLKHLDLSMNQVEGKFPISLGDMYNIMYLDFSYNNLEGELYELLGNSSTCAVKNLVHLDLSHNSLSGALPNQLGKLQKLSILGLSFNSFSGLIPMSISKLSSLKVLDMACNKLIGKIPTSIGNLSLLGTLDVSLNQLNGAIPTSIGKLLALRILDVSHNELNGAIPTSLGNLWNLERLYITNNELEGSVSELHFCNLTRLVTIFLSSNQLKLTIQSDWIPPFQLQNLWMGSMEVGPQFPRWIQSQKDLQTLDLSNSRIFDIIPSSFWSYCSQIYHLQLSRNQIHGNIPSLSYGEEIILSSNNFSGPLPQFSPTIKVLDLSNNSFHGSLSPIFCEGRDIMSEMEILNLSGNLLYGELPDCWMNYSYLEILYLGDNDLMGNIPNSLGTLSSLYKLSLFKNNLFGDLPGSLQNFTYLMTLDLSENNLSGNLSIKLDDELPRLECLVLRSNKFNGSIPRDLCDLALNLRILDLSQNNFSGRIPSCFGDFLGTREEFLEKEDLVGEMMYLLDEKGILMKIDSEVNERAFLITKGEKYEYNSNILSLVTSMDLSSNSLTGKIPEELTNLCWLRYLNLSNNHLHAKIPEKISAMKQLETLDLSMNQLTGVIPQGVASLTFLNNLNLSHNDLSGKIPTSTQLQSLSPFDFTGNQNLCGPPLTANCPGDNTSPKLVRSANDGGWMDKRWLYMGTPVGFVVGFWAVLGPLAFNKAWRYAYYKFWDDVKYQLFGGV